MTRRSCLTTCALAIGLWLAPGAGMAVQPTMHDAPVHLQAARAALEQATADKGGYRKRALRQINKAIDSVQSGIAHDRAN
jgi:hypothetical protein